GICGNLLLFCGICAENKLNEIKDDDPRNLKLTSFSSNPKQSTKTSCGIIGLCPVVINKNPAVAKIAKNSAALCPYIFRGFQPAGSFEIKIFPVLKVPVVFFGEKFNSHF